MKQILQEQLHLVIANMVDQLGPKAAEKISWEFDEGTAGLIHSNVIQEHNLTPQSTVEEIYDAVEITVERWAHDTEQNHM